VEIEAYQKKGNELRVEDNKSEKQEEKKEEKDK